MFTGEKISVPVLGLVENMAWFTPAELPGNRYYIFGKDGCKKLAQEMGITLLGQIPIVQGICEDGDAGRPSALDKNNPAGRQFSVLAENLKSALQIRNKIFSPTKKVEVESKSIFGKLKPKK
jgi:ATP-binding protein involved in chromosome partitioning